MVKAVLFALVSAGLLRKSDPTSSSCYKTGKAKEYRGLTEMTRSGVSCMRWDKVTGGPQPSPDNGIGTHSYCRAPNGESQPYCYRQDKPDKQEVCNIEECVADTRNVQSEARAVATYVGSHDCQCAEQLF